jgi:hypothetical protein
MGGDLKHRAAPAPLAHRPAGGDQPLPDDPQPVEPARQARRLGVQHLPPRAPRWAGGSQPPRTVPMTWHRPVKMMHAPGAHTTHDSVC